MKFAKTFSTILVAASFAAISTGALASGSHGGGHSEETAIGKAGVATKNTRTVTVEMADNMRYTPSEIQVKKGETVRFVVKNVGKVRHELSLGTEKELLKHLEQMKKNPGMEHDEPSKIDLLELGHVHFSEREQQHEKCHQQRCHVGKGSHPCGSTRFAFSTLFTFWAFWFCCGCGWSFGFGLNSSGCFCWSGLSS